MKTATLTEEILRSPGWTQARLATHLGVTQSTVHRWLKGSDPGGPSTLRLMKLHGEVTGGARETQYAPNPDDEISPEAVEAMERNGVSTLKPYQGQIPGASPDIDVSAGAGPGGLPLPASIDHGGVIYSADAVRGEIVLPDYLLSEFTRANAARVHWIAVRGDSMSGTLEPGDRVMVDTTDTAIGQGGVFVLRDPDGEVLVKRLRKLGGGKVEVVSDNERQGNLVHDSGDILIVGRVVGRLGRL